MITFDNWQIASPDGFLGYQYDNLVRMIVVTGQLPPEVETWDMVVEINGHFDCITLDQQMEGGIGAILTAQQLAVEGYYHLQLRGSTGVSVQHANQLYMYVPGSLDGSAHWPAIPSEFTQLEKRCRLLSEQAEQAAVRAETAAAGVQDISLQVQQVEASKQAAEAAAKEAKAAAEGVKDVSQQVEQVQQGVAAAQAAQSAAEQAAVNTGADRQAVETTVGQVAADKSSIDQLVTQAGTLASQIRQDTQTNGQLAAQIAQDAQQAKADAASVAVAMPKLEAAVPAADRAEAAQQAAEVAKAGAETAKTDAVSAAKKAEDAAAAAGKDLGLTGAEAGQYIEVLSVDSQGRPTGWKTVPKPEGGEKPWKVLNVVEVTAEQGEYVGKVIDAGDDGVKYKDQKLTQIIGRWSAPAGESNESFYLYVNGLYPNLRDLGGFIGTNEGHGYFEVNAIATAIQVELDPIIRLRGDPCDLVKRLMGWADGNRSGIIESLNFNKNHFRVGTKMTIYGR